MDNNVNNKEYEFNAFLSWTGADRALKDQIKDYFEQRFEKQNCCYDSDLFCKGDYRENFTEALSKTKVYVMILTDGLLSNATSEVKGEVRCAKDFENIGDLNIVILCTTPKLRKGAYDYLNMSNTQKFYYTYTSGYSRVDAATDENGLLSEADLDRLFARVYDFVDKRDKGVPAPPVDIFGNVYHCKETADDEDFVGRRDYIQKIKDAFDEGSQIVILRGIGGIGKTSIAKRFASEYDAENKCRFIQVVKFVQSDEQASMSGLRLLVTKTTYETSFIQSLSNQREEDVYKLELQEMQKLGPYCLILADGFDKVDEDQIKELVANLKCRLILTTRANVDESLKNSKYVKTIEILPMQEEEAYELFSRQYKNGSFADFKKLYKILDGHTFLINLAGRLLKKHGMSLAELIQKLSKGGLESLNEQVRHTYNDSGRESVTTLLGHLSILFDASCLDESEKDLLKKLAPLLEGKVSEGDMRAYFGQSNRNVLNRLLDMGWISFESENDSEYFMMHSIISQFILESFEYSEDCMLPAARYVLDKYKIFGDDIPFSTAFSMEPNVFYVLYWYAKKLGKLHRELWDRFTEFNTILGNYAHVSAETEQIAALLTSDKEKGIVKFYDACSKCQVCPDDAIDADLISIAVDETNYKEVMRLLPMIADVQNQFGSEHFKEGMTRLYKQILNVAIRLEDDPIIYSCLCSLILSGADVSEYKKFIKNNATIDRPELYLCKMFFMGDMYKVYAGGNFAEILQDPEGAMRKNKKMYFHMRSLNKFYNEILEYDGSHPVLLMLCDILKNAEDFDDSENIYETFDWEKIFGYCLQYLESLQQNGYTMITKNKYLGMLVSFLKLLPTHMQGDMQQYVAVNLRAYDTSKAAVGDVDKFLLAGSIMWSSNPLLAIKYCDRALTIQLKYHAEVSYATVSMLVDIANRCLYYKLNDAAYKHFCRAYEIIKDSEGFDILRGQICDSMLYILYISKGVAVSGYGLAAEIGAYRAYRDAAKRIKTNDADKCVIHGHYMMAMLKILLLGRRDANTKMGMFTSGYKYISGADFASTLSDELKQYMSVASAAFSCSTQSQQAFLLDNIFSVFYTVPKNKNLRFETDLYALTTRHLLGEFKKLSSDMSKSLKRIAKAQYRFLLLHMDPNVHGVGDMDIDELKSIIEYILSHNLTGKSIFVSVLSSYFCALGEKYKNGNAVDMLKEMFDGDSEIVASFGEKAQRVDVSTLCGALNNFTPDSRSVFYEHRKEFARLKGTSAKRRKEAMKIMTEAVLDTL